MLMRPDTHQAQEVVTSPNPPVLRKGGFLLLSVMVF